MTDLLGIHSSLIALQTYTGLKTPSGSYLCNPEPNEISTTPSEPNLS
jgi:hypothetical protein